MAEREYRVSVVLDGETYTETVNAYSESEALLRMGLRLAYVYGIGLYDNVRYTSITVSTWNPTVGVDLNKS